MKRKTKTAGGFHGSPGISLASWLRCQEDLTVVDRLLRPAVASGEWRFSPRVRSLWPVRAVSRRSEHRFEVLRVRLSPAHSEHTPTFLYVLDRLLARHVEGLGRVQQTTRLGEFDLLRQRDREAIRGTLAGLLRPRSSAEEKASTTFGDAL